MIHDVAIVGGGPAGLALAIDAAQRGFSTVVLERQALPVDKACGEGLMPSGLRALERLGVRALLREEDCAPFSGICYVQEDGRTAVANLPEGGGLGIRRVALNAAMARRAAEVGVLLRDRTEVLGHRRTSHGVRVELAQDAVEARLLVAADGLGSPLRRAEGMDRPVEGPRRFGLRRHFRTAPWSRFVEVYFCETAEAYVTPAGSERVGIAFLWEDGRVSEKVSFETLLARFPLLEGRLRGVVPDSPALGAGPLERAARHQVGDQFALLGDAAGYVDAITGEGLSLAFGCAAVLANLLPLALANGATRGDLIPYEKAYRRAFARYARLTRGMLMLARRPAARRLVVRWLGAHPRTFERIVAAAIV